MHNIDKMPRAIAVIMTNTTWDHKYALQMSVGS